MSSQHEAWMMVGFIAFIVLFMLVGGGGGDADYSDAFRR